MYKLRFLLSVAAMLFISLALCSLTQAAPRTFVSGLGSDANPCTRTAPCRTFQVAHNAVDANGEVLALDSAGYGTLTITKNVTISGDGVEATANALSGDCITIGRGFVNALGSKRIKPVVVQFEFICPTNFSLSPELDKLKKLVGHQTAPLPIKPR